MVVWLVLLVCFCDCVEAEFFACWCADDWWVEVAVDFAAVFEGDFCAAVECGGSFDGSCEASSLFVSGLVGDGYFVSLFEVGEFDI